MAQQNRIQRLSVWYDEKNYAWPRWSKMIGFYKKSLVKGKPSYTSEHEDGKYAIWFDENRNYWQLGPSSALGKKEWNCYFHACGKGDDIHPTDTGYSFSECLTIHLRMVYRRNVLQNRAFCKSSENLDEIMRRSEKV